MVLERLPELLSQATLTFAYTENASLAAIGGFLKGFMEQMIPNVQEKDLHVAISTVYNEIGSWLEMAGYGTIRESQSVPVEDRLSITEDTEPSGEELGVENEDDSDDIEGTFSPDDDEGYTTGDRGERNAPGDDESWQVDAGRDAYTELE